MKRSGNLKTSIETIQSEEKRKKKCFTSTWKELQGPVGKYQSKNHLIGFPEEEKKKKKWRNRCKSPKFGRKHPVIDPSSSAKTPHLGSV